MVSSAMHHPPSPACPCRPIPGGGRSGNGVVGQELQSLFPNLGRCHCITAMNTTTRAPLYAAPALLDARGFRGPPSVEMSESGAV